MLAKDCEIATKSLPKSLAKSKLESKLDFFSNCRNRGLGLGQNQPGWGMGTQRPLFLVTLLTSYISSKIPKHLIFLSSLL